MRCVYEERLLLPGKVEERQVPPSRVEEIYRGMSKMNAKGNMFGKRVLLLMYAQQCRKYRGSSSTHFHLQHDGRIAELEARFLANQKEMEERLKYKQQEMEEGFKKQENERVEKRERVI